MSTNFSEADETMMCCASCGIAEVDDIKLKTCTACKSARYCSIKCQKEHRPKHKKACKKRAAELRDEILFRQPESTHYGDCPICCLPLSIDPKKSILMPCCCKQICRGCEYAIDVRELQESRVQKCPFCRHPVPEEQNEMEINVMKRVEVNDPIAVRQMGMLCMERRDADGAVEYSKRAAELGDAGAHFNLSLMYRMGTGVEKDEKKELYHLEEAAIGGHPSARNNLGYLEFRDGRQERAVKHWIIAAILGCDSSMNTLRDMYAVGYVRKEDFAAALSAHQAAVDATKSPQREVAEAALHWSSNF